MKIKAVYRLTWYEYERGWGSDFDSYTYHKDLKTAQEYRQEMMQDQNDDYHFYTDGQPKLMEVPTAFYNKVQRHGTYCGELE